MIIAFSPPFFDLSNHLNNPPYAFLLGLFVHYLLLYPQLLFGLFGAVASCVEMESTTVR